ncbi:MAG: DUF3079 domain-containing protein [Rhodoferax sp.]
MATKKFPIAPPHPERVCWGCDKFCSANDMRCGNGSDRTPHPMELFGEDWFEWSAPVENPLTGSDRDQGNTAPNTELKD